MLRNPHKYCYVDDFEKLVKLKQFFFSNQAMQDKCEGEHSCEVGASNGIFGDPCRGTRKYLTASWQCIAA